MLVRILPAMHGKRPEVSDLGKRSTSRSGEWAQSDAQHTSCATEGSLQPKQRVIKFYIAPRPEHQSAPGCLRWRLCVSRLKLDLGSSGTYVGARRGVKSCLYPMNA
ncbi:hypothetical protein CGMCC3_g17644 [Colletotrichum fructicola]|nr:uncharacterized protein CGMCC3_g17644 [Colletotrichum fructicola]KAE9566185.1 hypothetical protein CGMCC3_g17644 [Colletotrichum fructicola]